jgi:hypothetical protein
VLIAFYRARREVEVAGIGGAAVVNGVLNGAITRVKEARKCGWVKGGNEGLDRSGPLHGARGGRRGGLGMAACEEEAALGWRRQRRKRETDRARWAKRLSGLASCWADWARSWKNPFRIKIGFLNVLRLWKFAQGHLGGILTQGFFVNSSRILKDFRKIQYGMPWMQP